MNLQLIFEALMDTSKAFGRVYHFTLLSKLMKRSLPALLLYLLETDS